MFFATAKKLSMDEESPHFLIFSAKHHNCKIAKLDGHGKLRNGHGKVMEKYFVKSVGTLVRKKNRKTVVHFDFILFDFKNARPNQGNTDLWRPLQSLTWMTSSTTFRNVYVISDGHFSSDDVTIMAVREGAAHNRVFTLGIG